MLRSLLLILMSAALILPSSAGAQESRASDDRVEWTMHERIGHGGSDTLLCPELVELTLTDERVRRLLEEFFDTDSGLEYIGEAPPSVSRTRSGSCDDVVQCFRVAGVRLLTYGTAPPGVHNED